MKQNKGDAQKQVFYLGRWVDKDYFRAFVYKKNEKKLAKSYDEFESLLKTGIWFDSPDNIPKEDSKNVRKPKHESSKPIG